MGDRPASDEKKSNAKPGRKRRVAGWVLLAFGVLITGVWAVSGWGAFGWSGWNNPTWRVGATHGCVYVQTIHPGMPGGADGWAGSLSDGGSWDFRIAPLVSVKAPDQEINLGGYSYTKMHFRQAALVVQDFALVLWPFALASLLGGGWLVWSGRRARRRAMTGLCRKCGYDLAGLAAGAPCPECGKGAGTIRE